MILTALPLAILQNTDLVSAEDADTLNGDISGFHWYADDESKSIDTGYTVTISASENDKYEITVTKN